MSLDNQGGVTPDELVATTGIPMWDRDIDHERSKVTDSSIRVAMSDQISVSSLIKDGQIESRWVSIEDDYLREKLGPDGDVWEVVNFRQDYVRPADSDGDGLARGYGAQQATRHLYDSDSDLNLTGGIDLYFSAADTLEVSVNGDYYQGDELPPSVVLHLNEDGHVCGGTMHNEWLGDIRLDERQASDVMHRVAGDVMNGRGAQNLEDNVAAASVHGRQQAALMAGHDPHHEREGRR